MAQQGTPFQKPLASGKGSLVLSGEEVSASREVATIAFAAKDLDKKDLFGKSDPFIVLYRALPSASFVPVCQTEVVKNNLNPIWKKLVVPVPSLCQGDEERTVKIECYDHDSDGTHDLIGACETTLKQLKEGPGPRNVYTLVHPEKQKKKGKSYKGSGQLLVQSFSSEVKYSFVDYIRGGLQLHFTVAVDFTASNGDPQHPKSLHFRQTGVDNQYVLAIKAVGEIIQDYDTGLRFWDFLSSTI